MTIRLNRFPEGRLKAFTASYDDGRIYDERLAPLFSDHGIRATFHLNSGFWDTPDYITSEQAQTLYLDHEISLHTYTHPHLPDLPDSLILDEILRDKEKLEKAAGYVVRGMSYPYGQVDDRIIALARSCGMLYSRTVVSTRSFGIPSDFMRWNPTCHHYDDLDAIWDRFENARKDTPALFYIWGHSYEFDRNNNWEIMERFCDKAAGKNDVWYATNIEIYDYVTAVRRLEFSADREMVLNPSVLPVWIEIDGEPIVLPAGKLTCIGR